MSTTETFQIPLAAAEDYERTFVPAIFAEWAPLLVDDARLAPGQAVLDVACGTGIVARTAADRIAGDGEVVGVDLNQAMLTVARRVRPELEWHQADAGSLPFPDAAFDRVLCQMSLMFFPDRVEALREMGRVSTPSGLVGIVVPALLSDQPAYGPFVTLAERHGGAAARTYLSTYWNCGDLDRLTAEIEEAGLRVLRRRTHQGTASYASVDSLVATEVEGTPLVRHISDAVYGRIREGAREVLAPFTRPDGSVRAPLHGHLVIAAVEN